MIGTDAFQEIDITGITSPITKHNYLVQNVEDLPRIIAEAFYIASTGRPGPVLIDIPRDISQAVTEYVPITEVDIRSYKPTVSGHMGMICLLYTSVVYLSYITECSIGVRLFHMRGLFIKKILCYT